MAAIPATHPTLLPHTAVLVTDAKKRQTLRGRTHSLWTARADWVDSLGSPGGSDVRCNIMRRNAYSLLPGHPLNSLCHYHGATMGVGDKARGRHGPFILFALAA